MRFSTISISSDIYGFRGEKKEWEYVELLEIGQIFLNRSWIAMHPNQAQVFNSNEFI